MTDTIRFRSDETARHMRAKSPADAPPQDPDIEKYDQRRSAAAAESGRPGARPNAEPEPSSDDEDRHEKRPEGPYKDPADERKQGEVK